MRVILTDDELDKARIRGIRLKEENRNAKEIPAYQDQSRKVYKDEADAGFVMSVAECAVAKAVNREWHAKVWPNSENWKHRDEADVGRNIEVRHITHPEAGLVVRQKDVETNKINFCAYPDPATGYREVEVIGWLPAATAWEIGKWSEDGTYKRVPQHLLRTEGM